MVFVFRGTGLRAELCLTILQESEICPKGGNADDIHRDTSSPRVKLHSRSIVLILPSFRQQRGQLASLLPK